MLMCETKGSVGVGACNFGKTVILEYSHLKNLIFFPCEIRDSDIHIEGKMASRNGSLRGESEKTDWKWGGGGESTFKITQFRFFESRKCIMVVSALSTPSI